MSASHPPHGNTPHVTEYPRITLHCSCQNEFNINVMRFKNKETVCCQVCGAQFPPELGEQFANALYEMFKVKHGLDKQGSDFDISFVYKSTFKQPPAPHPFLESDFPDA